MEAIGVGYDCGEFDFNGVFWLQRVVMGEWLDEWSGNTKTEKEISENVTRVQGWEIGKDSGQLVWK